MKLNFEIKRVLKKNELKNILGGLAPSFSQGEFATCEAKCAGGVTVKCTGAGCVAVDGVGCFTVSGGKKKELKC
ncbi:hypothetical protein [uncultured Tenacibaculum sp.]|uniref:hypothetical protein n=1 Tax=Tenacibaculum sp. ZS6-P6 TaxID=3447503 RepID=UPI00261F6B3D|nr:hypothetical protein [uncultured Tenacibaculum sp.]